MDDGAEASRSNYWRGVLLGAAFGAFLFWVTIKLI